MVESIGELDQTIREELAWTKEDSLRFLTYEDHPGKHIVLKEREWIPPSEGKNKLIKLLENTLEAKRLQNVRGMMRWAIPRRKVEAPAPLAAPLEHLESPAGPQPVTVKLSQLQYGKFSPRKTNKKWIEHLKEAIQAEGVQSFPPPKVRIHPNAHNMAKTQYQLVDGEHFCRALEELSVKEVTVEVHALTDEEADFKAMRFNQVHGKPLEPIEEARHLKKMIETYGYTQEKIGEKFCRTQQWVSKRLALLEVAKDDVSPTTRVVTPSHAEKIRPLPEEDKASIVDKIEREELSTRETAKVLKEIEKHPERKKDILTKTFIPTGVVCFCCHLGTYSPVFYDDKAVCPSCEKDPKQMLKLKQKPSPPKKPKEKEPPKPKDTGEQRRAHMHPQHSRMELEVIQELQVEGWPIETDIEIPLTITRPDGYVRPVNMPLYVDGIVHEGHEDRDERIDKILRRRGLTPVRERYNHYSKKNKERIKEGFRKAMREKGLEVPPN